MRRQAASILFLFMVSMVCLGILSRAVDGTGIALVATERMQEKTLSETVYPSCVPSTAVYSDGARTYVYVLDERSGLLGPEQIVRKVDVAPVASDGAWTALSDGALSARQDVVVRSDRTLSENDRVRRSHAEP